MGNRYCTKDQIYENRVHRQSPNTMPPSNNIDGIWNNQCYQWEKKLVDLEHALFHMECSTRDKTVERIWDKLDPYQKGRLGEKASCRFLYELFAECHQRRPKFQVLEPLLISLCSDIQDIMSEAPTNITYQETDDTEYCFISRDAFVLNICEYLKRIIQTRGLLD